MGLFSKRKKGRKYQSEDAHDEPDPDYKKRKDPYLIIGDAPPRPYFAGKGLESNTHYNLSREDEDEKQWGDVNHPGDCGGNCPVHTCGMAPVCFTSSAITTREALAGIMDNIEPVSQAPFVAG